MGLFTGIIKGRFDSFFFEFLIFGPSMAEVYLLFATFMPFLHIRSLFQDSRGTTTLFETFALHNSYHQTHL
jgi:hypothetical protein